MSIIDSIIKLFKKNAVTGKEATKAPASSTIKPPSEGQENTKLVNSPLPTTAEKSVVKDVQEEGLATTKKEAADKPTVKKTSSKPKSTSTTKKTVKKQ